MTTIKQWGPEDRNYARITVKQVMSVLDLAESALSVRLEREPAPSARLIGRTVMPDLTSILDSITLAKGELQIACDELQPEGDVEWLRKNGWEV